MKRKNFKKYYYSFISINFLKKLSNINEETKWEVRYNLSHIKDVNVLSIRLTYESINSPLLKTIYGRKNV